MTSIIKVTSVQDTSGNNETTTANIKKSYDGAAKAWFNLDYSDSSTRDSLNIASLTDNGTGDHDLNFTNNMGNTTYTLATCGNSAYSFFISTVDENSLLTTDVRIRSYTGGQSLADSNLVLGSVQGDLA